MLALMRRLIVLCLACFVCSTIAAQNRNVNWRFGNRAALVFQNGNPQLPADSSSMVSLEGCATVSDRTTGNLLIYSNGIEVRNALDQVMPNGSELLAGINLSATQGVIIVPQPDAPLRYYVFTVDQATILPSKGFRYSVVDMGLNNGLGDVVSNEKNILIQTSTSERLTTCLKDDGSAHWVLMHERGNRVFKAFTLDAGGLQPNPVVSSIGSIQDFSVTGSNGNNLMGVMKVSPDRSQIAVTLPNSETVELFDFDACTGQLSNVRSIPMIDGPYALEFSPDSRKLYVSLYYNASLETALYQINLDALPLAPTLVGVSSTFNYQGAGSLQLGPDNRIYWSIVGENWLSAITQPNAVGQACNFVEQFINLGQFGLQEATAKFGLPQTVFDTEYPSLSLDDLNAPYGHCVGEPFTYSVDSVPGMLQLTWKLQKPGLVDTAFNQASFTYTAPSTGTYTLSLHVQRGCGFDSLVNPITVGDCAIAPDSCISNPPNVFSPNGDALNAFFLQQEFCKATVYQLHIYNRWGMEVFQSNSPQIGWNGRQNNTGADVPEGTYYYVLQYQNAQGEKIDKRGTVLLLR